MDEQMDRQTDGKGKQTDRETYKYIHRRTEREKNVQIDRLIERDVNYLKFYLFVKFD
jgi:hypothetical protein